MSTEKFLPEIQPPTDPVELSEWLQRMIILINGALENADHLEPTPDMPDYVFDGMVVYFNRAILPDITEAGPWINVQGTWKKMFV